MQLTDETALWIAEMMGLENFKVEYLYDPETNIKFGCWLLNNLEKQLTAVFLWWHHTMPVPHVCIPG